MRPADVHFLLSETGQQYLQNVQITEQNHLQQAVKLRQKLTVEQTHAILETALLRHKARAKFSQAAGMYFVAPALEQASGEEIATYRAQRFARPGFSLIADLCCSIGGDAIPLTQHAQVLGLDLDQVRLLMARENVRATGRAEKFHPIQANLLQLPPLPVSAFFFDPARRDERGRRLFSVQDYSPPLSLVDQWLTQVPHGGVKISPGVDYAELPAAAEAEFISVAGEVKECVLWYGALHSGVTRRATLLPSGATLTAADRPLDIPLTTPQAYLYEPDGAVIRAHLVQELAEQLGCSQLDRTIAYLTSDQLVATPFAQAYQIEDYFPFQLKQLRHYLRGRGIGQLTIKKRGSPLDPDELRQQLKLKGDNSAHIFLTQNQGQPLVLVGRPVGNK